MENNYFKWYCKKCGEELGSTKDEVKTFDGCPTCGGRSAIHQFFLHGETIENFEWSEISINRDISKKIEKERLEKEKLEKVKQREEALDFKAAIEIWESLGEIKEAARVRKLQAELGSVKLSQKVKIRDSVLNRSNVGGGSSKMQELKELKEMRDSGDVSDEDYEKMKREIIG